MNYCCATRVRCEWSEGLYACLRQELLVRGWEPNTRQAAAAVNGGAA